MGGVINFGSPKSIDLAWFCTGWCFEAILDAIVERYRDDEELVGAVLVGKYNQGLFLDFEVERSPAVARRIKAAIKNVARELVEDDNLVLWVNKRKLGPDEMSMFKEGMVELLDVLRREEA